MFRCILAILAITNFSAHAQILQKKEDEKKGLGIRLPKYVATKNSFGMIAGIERGQYTFMELGVEKHWKKIRMVNARTIGANANLEYNFGNNIVGYNAAGWIKQGRVNLTYGISFNYITDFEKKRYGFGPQIGFRLAGFHFVNGYNFLLGNEELTDVNTLYVGLRYYFPLQSKTTVVNINKKKATPKNAPAQGSFFNSNNKNQKLKEQQENRFNKNKNDSGSKSLKNTPENNKNKLKKDSSIQEQKNKPFKKPSKKMNGEDKSNNSIKGKSQRFFIKRRTPVSEKVK